MHFTNPVEPSRYAIWPGGHWQCPAASRVWVGPQGGAGMHFTNPLEPSRYAIWPGGQSADERFKYVCASAGPLASSATSATSTMKPESAARINVTVC